MKLLKSYKIWGPILLCCLAVIMLRPIYEKHKWEGERAKRHEYAKHYGNPIGGKFKSKGKSGTTSAVPITPPVEEQTTPSVPEQQPLHQTDWIDIAVKGGAILGGLVNLTALLDKLMKIFKRKTVVK